MKTSSTTWRVLHRRYGVGRMEFDDLPTAVRLASPLFIRLRFLAYSLGRRTTSRTTCSRAQTHRATLLDAKPLVSAVKYMTGRTGYTSRSTTSPTSASNVAIARSHVAWM